MPGPFPGMDPYLEAPAGWPEVHNSFMAEVRRLLNQTLPPRYVARIERYHVVTPSDGTAGVGLRPDGGIYEDDSAPPPAEGASESAGAKVSAAVMDGPRTVPSPALLVESMRTERLSRVVVEEVEDRTLVTAIELLSPEKKGTGESRVAYTRKQVEYADRGVSLLEIDLLRTGRRSSFALRGAAMLEQRGVRPHYLTLVRPASYAATLVQPVRLEDVLPVAPVPLLNGDGDHPLDLQFCFDAQYDGGAYRRLNAYDGPPDPPLPPEYRPWAAERIAAWREGREPRVPPPVDASPLGDDEAGGGG